MKTPNYNKNCRDSLMIRASLFTLMLLAAGCGSTKQNLATEQLLVSNAVDKSVAQIDFSPLAGHTVYLETDYLTYVKGIGFVNADYIISSLRQQLAAAGCRLQKKAEDAEFVVEARIGALGLDDHEVTYGIPQNDALSSAASIIPGSPPIPSIPEIALAKRQDQHGAAKIAVFAYHQESKQPIWQSGISIAHSDSRSTWLLGAGPIQRGTIYDGMHFAGSRLWSGDDDEQPNAGQISYFDMARFTVPQAPALQQFDVQQAGHEEDATPADAEQDTSETSGAKPSTSSDR